MDWGFVGVILSLVFGVIAIASIIVAIRLLRRKKPVWAYRTDLKISRDVATPPELKITFGTEEVDNVYKTLLVFFNAGNDIIRGRQSPTDVKENVTIHLKGAQILKEPTILKASKSSIGFTAKHVSKDRDNAVELDFDYLGHKDGAVIELWHSKYDNLSISGDVMNTVITRWTAFGSSRGREFYTDIAAFVMILLILSWMEAGAIHYIIIGDNISPNITGLVVSSLCTIVTLMFGLRRLFRFIRFPHWSDIKE